MHGQCEYNHDEDVARPVEPKRLVTRTGLIISRYCVDKVVRIGNSHALDRGYMDSERSPSGCRKVDLRLGESYRQPPGTKIRDSLTLPGRTPDNVGVVGVTSFTRSLGRPAHAEVAAR